MKIVEFSRLYQTPVYEYCAKRGVPALLVNSQIQWIEEDIVRMDVIHLRFKVGGKSIFINTQSMCKSLGIPYSMLPTKDVKAFTIGVAYLPLIANYCEQAELDYDSVVNKLDVVEDADIPTEVNYTHVSVRSTKPGKKYAVLYAPKLLKYLHDPSYGVWIYASSIYRDTIEATAELMKLDWRFLESHIEWVTDEESTFHVTVLNRVALYTDGTYRYLHLGHFKNVALGEEPFSYEN